MRAGRKRGSAGHLDTRLERAKLWLYCWRSVHGQVWPEPAMILVWVRGQKREGEAMWKRERRESIRSAGVIVVVGSQRHERARKKGSALSCWLWFCTQKWHNERIYVEEKFCCVLEENRWEGFPLQAPLLVHRLLLYFLHSMPGFWNSQGIWKRERVCV